MTTILAVKKNKTICIGADTLTIIGGSRKQSANDLVNSDKIIKYKSNYIGISGNHSLLLAIKDYLKRSKKKHSFNTQDEVFSALCLLHSAMKEEYHLIPSSENDDCFENSRFELLIVNPSGIFKTYELRSVQQFAQFCAIGTGASYALGATQALYDQKNSAELIVRKSLEVAAEFDDSTGLPGTFYSVKTS
jgi:ATP-dependent protease HslVU (ClpYQ) peptidase subunit